jgi:tight adherence protein C
VLVFLIFGVLLVAAFAALVGRAVAMPRLHALQRVDQIEVYGFHGRAIPEPVAGGRALPGGIDSIAKGLGTFVSGRTAGLSESELRRELMSAGLYRMTPVTLVGYRVLAAMVLASVAVYSMAASGRAGMAILVAPIALLMGWMLPMTIVRRKARFRLSRIDYELPELVDLLVVTVESGMGFSGSMQIAAERFRGPLGDELRLAMQEQAMGLPTDQALANMLLRSETDGMRSFVRSIRQGESLGVSIGQIMRNLAEEMRKRRRATAEERAQKAPIKLLFPLVGLIFPAIYVVLLAPALLSSMGSFGGGS